MYNDGSNSFNNSGSHPRSEYALVKQRPKRGKGWKIAGVILCALVLMVGTSLATIAIYSNMNSGTQQTQSGQLAQTPAPSIMGAVSGGDDNSSVSNATGGHDLTTAQVTALGEKFMVGIKSQVYASNYYNDYYGGYYGFGDLFGYGSPFGGYGSPYGGSTYDRDHGQDELIDYVTGSGFVITDDGYIVTNYHVIDNADRIIVYLHDNSEYEAELVGGDQSEDIAVLKIEASGLTYGVFGSSSSLVKGEQVIAMGSPVSLNFSGSVSMGLVSATDRSVTVEGNEMTLIQHSAAISSGSSGGALLNMRGEIVGINNARIQSTSAENMSFAIPVDNVKEMITSLVDGTYKSTAEPMIGITGGTIDADMAEEYGVPQGVYVSEVSRGGAAAAAGVMEGDIIISIAGQTVTTMEQLTEIKNGFSVGDSVELGIYRSGLTGTLTVVLG